MDSPQYNPPPASGNVTPGAGGGMGSDQNKTYMAYASLAIGVLSMCAWLLPICGCPMSLIGLGLGFMGKDTPQRTFAYIGLGLSALALLLTIGNAAYGAYTGMSGTNPLVNNLFNQ
jgi:hypothetical protein